MALTPARSAGPSSFHSVPLARGELHPVDLRGHAPKDGVMT